LESEDWATAENLTSKYLNEVKSEDNNNTLGRLRFMYLFSAAGRIAAGKTTYEGLQKKVEGMAGKEIVFPGRYLKANCRGGVDFNALCKSDTHDIMVTSTARDARSIFSFEYIKLKEKLDWAKNDGKVASISGTIESIAPNPNKSTLVIMRIYVVDGRVKVKD
ncbi:MAG TPA: hypothetical protein VJV05_08975, partial [Pyrinomonadaceae bacterium]|nr:hypothetical protein [Pyrinomonadaceae bacterium]